MFVQGESVEDPFPLSPLQQGMLFHSLFAQGSGVDIVQEISSFSEYLAVDAFERAWMHVVQRHPILRTRFQWQGLDRPVQQVHEGLPRCEWRDLQEYPSKEQEAQFKAFLQADRRLDFDLRRGPLMRLTVFRMAPSEYRCVWTFHHALLDGWCISMVLKEVFACYDAFRLGREPDVEKPRPYRDYVEWLANRDDSKAEAFWRDALRGFRAPTSLVVDRVESGARIYDPPHGDEELRLSESLSSDLRSLAGTHDVTLSTLIHAAWAGLLSRYTGDEDVVFGAVRQCRPPIAGAESIAGLFINTLPLRARLTSERTVLQLLRELRAQWVALRDYKHTALVDIQSWSDIRRGVPLFESIVVFENAQLNSTLRDLGGAWMNRTFRYFSQPNTPLNVAAYGERELLIRISYDRMRFDRDSIRRMLGHLATLLRGMAEDVDRRVSELPLLTPPERQRLLEWNSVDHESQSDEPVHRVFERHAQQRPDAVAVQFETEQLTYAELNRRANRLAGYLRGLGVGRESLVGVCLNRSLELVVALLGVLKAGGAYVPLDSAYPEERLAFIVEDARPAVVVTDTTLEGLFPRRSDVLMCLLDRDAEVIALEGACDTEAMGSPKDLAYVIYTSGSTGSPKGVAITHRNVARLFTTTETLFNFNESDVWTLFHSYAFDFSVWELWGALRYGGRLIVVPQWMARSAESFREALSEHGVTVLNQTPSAFRPLIAADASSESALRLRLVILGGEALDPRMLESWFDRHGDQSPQLVNMYGITETTVHVTHHRLSRADFECATSVIGRPIPDLQVYVLDRQLDFCPIGVPGQLHVAGPGLARGYLRRPELTKERFITNPFGPRTEARLYRSGDLGRYRDDGTIEYLGRIDHQVKIRGHRVEIGEIEAVLSRHPDVRESAVVARQDAPGDVRLIAYLVPRPETKPSEVEVRAFLKRSLPEYMLPSAFILITRLPLTPSGKLDRMALPLPVRRRSESEEGFVVARNWIEDAVAKIWSQVLGIAGLGVHDDFFERGGDSLMATQVISRVRDWFGVEVPIRALFDSPKVEDFAYLLSRSGGPGSPIPQIPRVDRKSNSVKLKSSH